MKTGISGAKKYLAAPATLPCGQQRLAAVPVGASLVGALFAVVLAVGMIGCGQGTYPLDIFYEMHYSQSYKPGEPPRLAGVENAVPWTSPDGPSAGSGWGIPSPKSTAINTGEHLYTVNCSLCHGASGKGDGPVLNLMMEQYGYEPAVTPDLTSQVVTAMGFQGIQGMMVSGITVMPSFSKLLTTEEIEMIADYVMTLE